jgi:hypothetical protein
MKFWFTQKRNKEPAPVSEKSRDKVILHDHDLSKWNYLGYSVCRFVDSNGDTTRECTMFMFVDKNNKKRRSYYLAGPHSRFMETHHPFIYDTLKPWAAGEGSFYGLIYGKSAVPSDFLCEYILEHFSSEWSNKTNWWVSTETAKYKSAKNKQEKTATVEDQKPELVSDGNVVSVKFRKEDT